MVRRKFFFIVALLLITAGSGFAAEPEVEIDRLLETWTDSLISEDIDGFLDCYWDEAVRINYNPGAESMMTQGMTALRREEQTAFDQLDFGSFNLIYDEPVRFFPDNNRPVYIYPNSRFAYMDVFEFEQRGGVYRIIRQYLMPHPGVE